jgi:hypothetical protein
MCGSIASRPFVTKGPHYLLVDPLSESGTNFSP